MKVVFVEDDPDIGELINAVAKCCDCDVHIFTNGPDALQQLQIEPADVAVLDLRLPTLDGLTIAEEIRRNENIQLIKGPIKLAFLTGAEITDAIQRVAERVGVEKIFQKPVDYNEVLEEMKGWFENEKSQGAFET
jgi:CheY-like chemotaxis protein